MYKKRVDGSSKWTVAPRSRGQEPEIDRPLSLSLPWFSGVRK